MSHANLMSHYTLSIHLKSSLVIVALFFIISHRVNATKSLVIPSNVQGKLQPYWIILQYSWPFIIVSVLTHLIYHVTPHSYFFSYRWWGIHHGLHSGIWFLSTSTHHMGNRLRNQLVPSNLHASMACLLIFYYESTTLASN